MSRRARVWPWAACALALALLAPSPAAADGVVVLESSEVDPALRATLAELLARIDVRLVRSAGAGEVVAYLHIEPTAYGALLRVEDAQGRDLDVRREVTRTGTEALFRETLAHVVLSAVEPLTDRPPAAPEPEPEPAPEPAASEQALRADALDVPARRARPRLLLGLRGGPLWLAPQRMGPSLTAALGVELGGALRPALQLEGGALWPLELQAGAIRARLRHGSLRLVPRFTPLRGTHAALDLGISAGADVVALVPERGPRGTEVHATRRLQPVAGGLLRVQLWLAPSLRLVASGGVDIDGAPRRWVVASERGETTLASLARVRPWAQLGVEWLSAAHSAERAQ